MACTMFVIYSKIASTPEDTPTPTPLRLEIDSQDTLHFTSAEENLVDLNKSLDEAWNLMQTEHEEEHK